MCESATALCLVVSYYPASRPPCIVAAIDTRRYKLCMEMVICARKCGRGYVCMCSTLGIYASAAIAVMGFAKYVHDEIVATLSPLLTVSLWSAYTV